MDNQKKETNMEEFQKACEPLFEYLKNNHHPHMTVIITFNTAELVEGVRFYNKEQN